MTSNVFRPDWVSPPGDSIKDILRDKSISLTDLARNLGETIAGTEALLRGHAELTVKHAKKLETLFGAPHTFWLSREEQYRSDLKRSKSEEASSLSLQWFSELPVKDMVRFGWLSARLEKKPTLADCLNFFGVVTVSEWRNSFNQQLGLSSFRTSSSFEHKPLALAAWLRKAEIDANEQECNTWDPIKFQHRLLEIRQLTRTKSPAEFLPILKNICNKVGVALAIVRLPSGCRASGAARFLTPNKAVITLSFRHLTDDHFWFTFFHEAGHLILHNNETIFIDGIEADITNLENEANEFAQNLLIPAKHKVSLSKIGFTPKEILRFAKDIGVSPGIVIGQIQNSGRIRHDQYNSYKQRFTWDEIES